MPKLTTVIIMNFHVQARSSRMKVVLLKRFIENSKEHQACFKSMGTVTTPAVSSWMPLSFSNEEGISIVCVVVSKTSLLSSMASSKGASTSKTWSSTSSSSSLLPHLTFNQQHAHHFTGESIKVIGESVGVGNLSDASAKYLADHVTGRIKLIIQESAKFEHKAKRKKLFTSDVDFGLRCLNVEPVYGFQVDSCEQGLPFRLASGGGRELVFLDAEKEIDVLKLATNSNLPKIPPEVALKPHWLALEDIQPAIPENPAPVSKQEQRLEAIDPLAAQNSNNNAVHSVQLKDKLAKKKRLETVKLKQLATHELSVEQQLYYKEITEACVGSDETKRAEALQSLTFDNGLHQMLPRLCTFISEGVKVNVVQNNLALLIYLMRMVKAILDNNSLYLEKYLHELIPTIVTCIVSKQLCMRPEADNHWALRDFAARLLAQTSKAYNTATNNIQVRLTRILTKAIDSGVPLSSAYGALSALCELGVDVQRTLVFKRIKVLGERITSNDCAGISMGEFKAAVDHVKTYILKVIPNTIKGTRPGPDNLEDFKQEFGYLFGPLLHSTVVKLRTNAPPLTTVGPGSGTQMSSPSSVHRPMTGGQPILVLPQSGQNQAYTVQRASSGGHNVYIMKPSNP